jgi:3-hydroxybutyryl-CoA dehydratase
MNSYRWDELSEGLSHEFEAQLTQSMLTDFLELSGDQNPLHTDTEFARHAGFRDIVAYGMLTSALYSTLVGVYLPGRYCLLQGIDVDFVNPAFLGDHLRVAGSISYLNQAYHRAEVKASIHNGDSQLISRAKIRVGVHEH